MTPLPEIHSFMALYVSGHITGLGIDVDLIPFNPAEMAADRIHLVLLPLKTGLENLMKACQRNVRQQFLIIHRRLIFCHLRRYRGSLVKILTGIHLHVPQFIRHILIGLILQQFLYQFGPGILFLSLFIHFLREKHPAFDIQQRSRHQQEFTHYVHILGLHLAYIIKILFRNFCNGYIINIHFVLFY